MTTTITLDQFERWLEWHRDQYDPTDYGGGDEAWTAIDHMLTDLRAHIARGLTLHEHVIEQAGPHNVGLNPRWAPPGVTQ